MSNRQKAGRLLMALGMGAGLLMAGHTSAMAAGWSVSGTSVLDPNGKAFQFRGINFPYVWYPGNATKGFADIAATRANAVRVVLGDGDLYTRTSGSALSSLIQLCKTNRLVCVLEVHDSTGYGDASGATRITRAAAYWTSADVMAAIKGQESTVVINIANEPTGNYQAATWAADTAAALQTMRKAGLTHLVMVDAPNWGQDSQNLMANNAATVFKADTLARTVFSVHMYESFTTYTAAKAYLDAFKAKGYALVIGEFGTQNNGTSIDAAGIMRAAAETGTGYIGWSWSGNGSSYAALDIVNNFNAASLSSWGTQLIYGCNGIGPTAKLATNYSATPAVTLPARCNWYGNTYPLCATTTTGTWGWENSASCVVKTACSALPSPYGVLTGTPTCTTTPPPPPPSTQVCNWYGNYYPLCTTISSGWGWENNASCVGKSSCSALPSPYGVVTKPTQCNWYGTTYPLCTTISSGWGWENNASCVGLTSCAALPAPYGPK